MNKKILITGVAGFIGFHLAKRLLEEGFTVIGVDNINDFYSVNLKYTRLSNLGINSIEANQFLKKCISDIYADNFIFYRINLQDRENLPKIFANHHFDVVCNFAAQPSISYSFENPHAYLDSNLLGFGNLLACIRQAGIKKLIYASSSSVYGNDQTVPFKEDMNVNRPMNLYAATKVSNELMAYSASYLQDLECIGLRLFTVYGPWGRPDMAIYLFTDAIVKKEPLKLYNQGELYRDFTYISDAVNGIEAVVSSTNTFSEKHRIYNIGYGTPIKLSDCIYELEQALGQKGIIEFHPLRKGDILKTWADTSKISRDYHYQAEVPLSQGIKLFVEWYEKMEVEC